MSLRNAWLRSATLALAMLAVATAPACELRPSRPFAPPSRVSSGPPVRVVTQTTAESDLDLETPPPPVDWDDNPASERVVERRLANGILLRALPRGDTPAATVLVVFGTKTIPSPLPTAVIYAGAALNGRSMPWSRQPRDGVRVFTVARPDFVAMGFTGLAPLVEGVLGRVLPETVSASLSSADVEHAKEDAIGGLGGHLPVRRARATAFASLFPAPHPYAGVEATAVAERIREVKVAEVHAFRDASLGTDNIMVTATGNVDVGSLVATLDRALANVPRAAVVPPRREEPRPSCAGQAIVIEDGASQQTSVNLAYPGVPARHADVPALQVLAAAAGGSISTHLNASLRRGRGLSHGFRTGLYTMRAGGLLSIEGGVDPSRTAEAIVALEGELDALRRTPLGDDDLRVAKIGAAHASARLGGETTAVRLAEASILGLPISDVPAIKAVTSEQVRAAAERYLQPAKRCIVAVGDAARLERDLGSAGIGSVSRGR